MTNSTLTESRNTDTSSCDRDDDAAVLIKDLPRAERQVDGLIAIERKAVRHA